jgi:hypothetical protein
MGLVETNPLLMPIHYLSKRKRAQFKRALGNKKAAEFPGRF